ncbi:hypothetical protein [Kitasatospora sp. NPDC005856]|uniref:hypothetical protein n=1 Tax=Kitasatospora sp. NPDC005856 TaxID=3154566 RepID=UPI0033E9B50F
MTDVRVWWRTPAAVLVAAQPVALVVWCLLARQVDFWNLAPLEASGAAAGLFLASRLLVRRSIARWQAEMRWFAWAALRYLVCCLTPFLLLTLTVWLITTGGRDTPGTDLGLSLLGMLVIWVHLPTLVLLLVQAPRAQRGAQVGALIGLLPTALPMLLVLIAGAWPLLLLIVAQMFFAFFVLPGLVSLPFLGALAVQG